MSVLFRVPIRHPVFSVSALLASLDNGTESITHNAMYEYDPGAERTEPQKRAINFSSGTLHLAPVIVGLSRLHPELFTHAYFFCTLLCSTCRKRIKQ